MGKVLRSVRVGCDASSVRSIDDEDEVKLLEKNQLLSLLQRLCYSDACGFEGSVVPGSSAVLIETVISALLCLGRVCSSTLSPSVAGTSTCRLV
jgi:hypothetical protein